MAAKRTRPRPGQGDAPARARKSRQSADGPAAPRPAAPGPSREALALYERAVAALQQRRYAEAAEAFGNVADRHPTELALVDRARVYLELCRRSLGGRLPEPRTVEERLTAATAALNDGDDVRAETLSRSVLDDNPRNDLALYLLATIEIRRGHADSAMGYLAQAIAVSPEVSAQARQDPDFEALREHETFQELTEPPPPGQAES
jgi:tetratricopeptide (TPR) repeat protein